MNKPRATVREENGRLVLDDPDALAVVRAVAKVNCRGTFEDQAERVAHFARRMRELGRSPAEVLIVLLKVDDPHGGPLAEELMPGMEWQPFRDRGEVPFARGLAPREAIESLVAMFDPEASAKSLALAGKVVTMVVDHGVAEVFEVA